MIHDMKILFVYLNSDKGDTLESVKFVKQQTFFLKYLKDAYVAKLELIPEDFRLVSYPFKEVFSSYDMNYDSIRKFLLKFDKMLILTNGKQTKYSKFLEKVATDIPTISISFSGDHPIKTGSKYDIKNNPTFLPAYGYIFNKSNINIVKSKDSTKKDSEIDKSLIYIMKEFSFIKFTTCLIHQTIPVIDSKYFRQDYFHNYPTIGKIVQNKMIYSDYNKTYEDHIIENYQEILKSIFKSDDWNRMLTEDTYIKELNKILG